MTRTVFSSQRLKAALQYAKYLSPMHWVECVNPDLKDRSASATEKYVIACVTIEVLVGVALGLPITQSPAPSWLVLRWPIGILAALRIIEILVRTVTVKEVILESRTAVLAGINYVELALCFGVIYALNHQCLNGAFRPITGFYFSFITQLTIGYGDVSPKGWLRLVVVLQGLIGLLFVVSVLVRAIAALPPVQKNRVDDLTD
jgi:hypothetical protein